MTARDRKLLYIVVPAAALLVWRLVLLVSPQVPSEAAARGPDAHTPTPAAASAPPAGERAAAELAARWRAQADAESIEWARDPFFSPFHAAPRAPASPQAVQAVNAAPAPAAPAWHFSGVATVGQTRAALLSGRIVTVGTELDGGFRVIDITARSVTLQNGPWRYRFQLGQPRPEVFMED